MPSAQSLAYHHLTVNDFHRMGEAGILHEDDRVELIDGVIIDMAPIGSLHASQVNHLTHRLVPAVSGRAIVAPQNPLHLGTSSEPQSDVIVLRYRADFYAAAHPEPSDVLLLIEVADTSLSYDRDVKIPLYARHAIPEVWLIDVQNQRVEVFRQPHPNGYQAVLQPANTERLRPVLLPDISVLVADLWGSTHE